MKVHLTKTKTINGGKLTYPLLGFAFNPIALKVTEAVSSPITLLIGKGSNQLVITREALNNEVVFDLSAVARSLFDRTEFHKIGPVESEKDENAPNLGITKAFSVHKDEVLFKKLECELKIGTHEPTSVTIPVIWGAMQIGETYSQNKTLKMFRGYPFTVPFFFTYLNLENQEEATAKASILVKKDNDNFLSGTDLEVGKHNLKVGSAIAPQKRLTIWVDNALNEPMLSTFDMTFDYTFRGLGATSFVIHVDMLEACGDNGYYLRWINSHGEYCYWLFKPQVHSMQVENKGIEFDEYYTTVNYTDNYHVGTGKSIGKKVTKTVQLYADFVDSADYDFLLGLVQSPVVDLYMGNTNGTDKWMSINIQPATFPKGKEHLQDFSFILELPQAQIQSL